MDNKLWIRRSQNLYIIRELWKTWSERDVDTFYKLIGIDDSSYSAYIRNPDISEGAEEKIKKRKEKIIGAGFSYEWFTGETVLCDSGFRINEKVWIKFIRMSKGDSAYKAVHEVIRKRVRDAQTDKDCEIYKVYNAVYRYNNKRIARQLEKYLTEIDIKNLSETEISELMKIADKLEEFIADIRAMNRYYEIKSRK